MESQTKIKKLEDELCTAEMEYEDEMKKLVEKTYSKKSNSSIAISFVLYETNGIGQKLVCNPETNNPRQFMSDGHAEKWVAENGERNKLYSVQRCVAKPE